MGCLFIFILNFNFKLSGNFHFLWTVYFFILILIRRVSLELSETCLKIFVCVALLPAHINPQRDFIEGLKIFMRMALPPVGLDL